MRVFLTGGTGLVGSHLVELLRGSGHEVVALHRRGSDTFFLEEQECVLVEGDVRDDAETLTPLVEGCSHVVHSAAFVYSSSAWPKIRAVNVDGTRNVLTAAKQAGVAHAIHVSSVAAYGRVDGPVDEYQELDDDLPDDDLYARSKREAEEVARGVERVQEIPVSIVRPSAIYGERDRFFSRSIAKIIRRLPVVPLIGSGENTMPTVYAGNVASALLRILEACSGGRTYDIGMDYPLTQRELIEGLAAGMGRRLRLVPTPGGLIRGAAGVTSGILRGITGGKNLPTDRMVRLGLNDNPYGSARLRAELDWTPPHQHAEALRRTGHWLSTRI